MIFSIFYHVALFVWLLVNLPKIIKRSLRSNIARDLFVYRIGIKDYLIPPSTTKRIWVHSVSLGETKAVESLLAQIKKQDPTISIICSHSTLTGLAQSQKNNLVDYSFLLPVDFSWIMKKLVKKIDPSIFILVETDFWPNLLHELKANNTSIVLVNGKISNTSFSRLKHFPSIANRLLRSFDMLLLQNEGYLEKFKAIGAKESLLFVTGNIKYDIFRKMASPEEIKQIKERLFIQEDAFVIIFGCTHNGEEEIALDLYRAFKERYPHIKWIIAPRHPHRFDAVKTKVASLCHLSTYSHPEPGDIIIIDQIGILDVIYQISDISILCGSFVSGIGGHNLFEPLHGNGVLFYGPFVENQKEMDSIIQCAHAGIKVQRQELKEKIEFFIHHSKEFQVAIGRNLARQMRGSTQRTFQKIEKFLWK